MIDGIVGSCVFTYARDIGPSIIDLRFLQLRSRIG